MIYHAFDQVVHFIIWRCTACLPIHKTGSREWWLYRAPPCTIHHGSVYDILLEIDKFLVANASIIVGNNLLEKASDVLALINRYTYGRSVPLNISTKFFNCDFLSVFFKTAIQLGNHCRKFLSPVKLCDQTLRLRDKIWIGCRQRQWLRQRLPLPCEKNQVQGHFISLSLIKKPIIKKINFFIIIFMKIIYIYIIYYY